MKPARPTPAPDDRVVVRPMTVADLNSVHSIEVASSAAPWSAELFADELTDPAAVPDDRSGRPDRHWLVATDRQSVIAFAGIMFVTDEAHIMNLAVDPSRRRLGIAARLVAELLLVAGDRGSVSATLEVRRSNEPALELYRRFGFTSAGRRPRYYPDGEDAAIMWAHRIYDPAYRAMLRARTERSVTADGSRSSR